MYLFKLLYFFLLVSLKHFVFVSFGCHIALPVTITCLYATALLLLMLPFDHFTITLIKADKSNQSQ